VTKRALSYALVTPARDEAANLGRLANCLVEQTVGPDAWLIVDDGSRDETAEIARELASRHPWIRLLSSPGSQAKDGPLEGGRRAGRDVVAFTTGLAALERPPDIVLKLDADVSFAPDFFECLLAEFEADPRLGIAGGTCWEHDGKDWRPYRVTGGHVRGATRAYRWECLQEVSPLEEQIGWDVLDEIRANLRGWHTRSLPDLAFYHHRALGARDGARRQWEAQGQMAHYLGYRFSYLVLRALWRGRKEPTALAMVPSFLAAKRRREPHCGDDAVRDYVRRKQAVRNLPVRLREALGR
jgi:glycosyltransferase involved in cell wall biosynthesis